MTPMSRRKITIPADIDAAVADLNGLGALITAKEWHRAAIVATFVSLADGKGKAPNRSSAISPKEFAALGIHGLKSDNTVRRYVQIWESSGEPIPTPGQEIEIPNEDWEKWMNTLIKEGEIPESKSTNTPDKVLANIAKDPKKTAEAMDRLASAQPSAAAKVAAKAIKTDEGRKAVAEEMSKSDEDATALRRASHEADVTRHVKSGDKSAAERKRKEAAAEKAAEEAAAATSGVVAPSAGMGLIRARAEILEFLRLADSTDYKFDPILPPLMREVGESLKGLGENLIDLADGKISKPSDEEMDKALEDLLSGS